MGKILDQIKSANARIKHTTRSNNLLSNALLIVRPQEALIKKRVKVRPIEEEYIRFLVFNLLNKDNIKKIAVLLRRMDWSKHSDVILNVIYKYLVKGKETQVRYI